MGLPGAVARSSGAVVVDDLCNRVKRHFNDLPVRALYLDGGPGERLRRLQTAHNAANAVAICSDDLNVIFAIKRFEGGESFGDFQWCLPFFHQR